MSADKPASALDLAVSPLHLDTVTQAETSITVLENFGFDGPAFERYIADHCKDGPGRIMMIETTASDWTHWECHTEADEVVVVLEGSGEFVQQVADEELRIPVHAGQAVINPRGVWHTADVRVPIKALYITPCRGTEHKAR